MGSCHSTLDIRYIFVVKTIESAKNFLFRILGRNASCDVISIVSDEQAYIAEFVHHYLYLGFSNIYLGINNSSDRTYAIIHKISEKYKNVIPINVDKQFWLGHRQDNGSLTHFSGKGNRCKVEVISRSDLLRARGYKIGDLEFDVNEQESSGRTGTKSFSRESAMEEVETQEQDDTMVM